MFNSPILSRKKGKTGGLMFSFTTSYAFSRYCIFSDNEKQRFLWIAGTPSFRLNLFVGLVLPGSNNFLSNILRHFFVMREFLDKATPSLSE